MTYTKKKVIQAFDKAQGTIPGDLHSLIQEALKEIEPLTDRDAELIKLWAEFGDISMNPETEEIEAPFIGFPAGTNREEIWHWFDERHSRGIHYLMYRDSDEPDWYSCKELLGREAMCFECESKACGYNDSGLCCFSLVRGERPNITEDAGCVDGIFSE